MSNKRAISIILTKLSSALILHYFIIYLSFFYLTLFSPLIFPPGPIAEAKELNLAEFVDLQRSSEKRLADQIADLKKSIDSAASRLTQSLPEFPSRSADNQQINLYFRNFSHTEFILTDIISHLDRKLTHYNFSVEDSGLFYRHTVKKFAISPSPIPHGKHELRLAFLLQPLPDEGKYHRGEKTKPYGSMAQKRSLPTLRGTTGAEGYKRPLDASLPPPHRETATLLRGCSLLSDARCLHKKPLVDNRVIKRCSLRFSWPPKEQPWSIIILFDDSNAPQVLPLPEQGPEKLRLEVEAAKGLFLNRDYLECLVSLNTLLRESASLAAASESEGRPLSSEMKALTAEAMFLKADCFLHLEIYHEAASTYQELRARFPESDYFPLSVLHSEIAHYLAGESSQVMADLRQLESWARREGPIWQAKRVESILDLARYLAARSLYQNRQFVQSANLLGLISHQSFCYLPARYLQALCHLATGDHKAAIDSLEALIIASPLLVSPPYPAAESKPAGNADNSKPADNKDDDAFWAMIKEDMRLALGEASEEMDTEQMIQSAHLLLGRLWYQQGAYEKSLKEFEAIPAKSSYYPQALTGLGLSFLRLRREDEVRKILDQFSSLSLENRFLSDARFSLADSQQRLGKLKEAAAIYQESIERCQEALLAIRKLQQDEQQQSSLLIFLLDANQSQSSLSDASSTGRLFPPTSLLYQEVADLVASKRSLSYWQQIQRMTRTLQAAKSLLLTKEASYQEKLQGLFRLTAQSKESKESSASLSSPSSPPPLSDPDWARFEKFRQAAFREILAQENRLAQAQEATYAKIKEDIHEALSTISSRLSEIHDRAHLEIEFAAFRQRWPSRLSTAQGATAKVDNKGRQRLSRVRQNEASDAQFLAALKKVIATHEAFISQHPQSPYLEKVLFQMAECSYLHSSLDYQQRLKLVEGGGNPADFLLETRPNFDQAIQLYERILARFPHGQYTEKTLYALGYTYQEQGAIILAKSLFQRLVQDFPNSSLAPETLVRLGEIFFDEGNFAQAADYYRRAASSGKLPPQYKNNVLYKLAWSYYKQRQDQQALELFILMADEYERSQNTSLLDEMIRQLAKMGTEYDSIAKVEKFFSPIEKKSYHSQVMKGVADLLFSQERFSEAINAYRWVLERYPFVPDAPLLQSKIEQCYLKLNDPRAANEAREHLVLNYGENSAWWDKNQNEAARKQASALIDESIRNSTRYLMESTDERDYQELIKFYRQNLSRFPSPEQVYTINFLLAECLLKTKQYEQALAAYNQVLQNKEFTKFAEEAAYKQIVCLEKMIEQTKKRSPEEGEGEEKIVGVAKEQAQPKEQQQQAAALGKPEEFGPQEIKFLAACDYLLKYFPRNEHLPEVLYKKGEFFLNKGQPQRAIDTLDYLIQHFPSDDLRPSALKALAKAQFSQERFDLAAKVYSEIVSEYDQKLKKEKKEDSQALVSARRNAFKMMALSSYKEAEALLRQGKPLEAARKFEATVDEFPGEQQIADLALFEAGKIYQAQGESKRARKAFDRILQHYPNSEYAPQVLLLIATEYEKNKQLEEAALNYERLYRDYPRFSGSAKALYRAGRLFEEVENWAKVITVFSLYQSDLRPEPALALEINFRRGHALMKSGGLSQAEAAFQVVLDTYERYKAQDSALKPYYPAWAQFLIGEIAFESYEKAAIEDLSDQGMKRKLELLKKVIESYRRAADFKIAEWAVQAIFKMGLAMDKFAEELADRLEDRLLAKEPKDENSYLMAIQLQERIIEFLEKAAIFYQQNVQLAEQNNLHDDTWIIKSKENLTKVSWQAGQRYEKIYSLIKDAPVPGILDEEQAKSYRQALLEKALPYQDRAVEMYAKNVKAVASRIGYNSWIEQSYQRLAAVRPEKYRRNEERPLAEDRSDLSFPEQLLLRE